MGRLGTPLLLVALATIGPRAARAQQKAAPNAAASTNSAAIDDTTRSQVLAARDAIWRAWFANDTVALARLLPRSTTAGEGGGWETRAEIVEASRRSASSGLRLVVIRFDDTRLHAQGNVVVVFSNYTMELEQQGRRSTVTGSASEIFVRTDGVWQNPFWYLGPRSGPGPSRDSRSRARQRSGCARRAGGTAAAAAASRARCVLVCE